MSNTARELIEQECPSVRIPDAYDERSVYPEYWAKAAEIVIDRLIAERDQYAESLAIISRERDDADIERRSAMEQRDRAIKAETSWREACSKLADDVHRATAAHILCDRERQEARDRVRELESKQMEYAKVDADHKLRLERERYRDRLDAMVAALLGSDLTYAAEIDAIVVMASALLQRIDAAVEARFSGEGK